MASERKKRKTSAVIEISRGDLGYVKTIGNGGSSSVFHMIWKNRSQEIHVAAKRAYKADKQELEVLSGLNHPNIVKLLAVVPQASDFMLILELCEGGSLRKHLDQDKQNKLTPGCFTTWATEAAEAIKYLHQEGVIHKDVKSENYLIANGVLKLADFGLSKHAEQTTEFKTETCTAAYTAPETLTDRLTSPKSDIFSLAVVVWELLTKDIPFEGREYVWIVNNVCGNEKLRLHIPADCPEDLADLMQQCWEEDRNKRPSVEEILGVVSKHRETLVADPAQSRRRETLETDQLPKEELRLRNYQLELAEPALQGPNGKKNVVIVAPTGSGKTIVAVKVVKDFLESEDEASSSAVKIKPKKVVFLVNQVLLVEQQTKIFQRFLDTDSIIGLSGETTQGPLDHILEEKTVLVMTAQVLVNAIAIKSVQLSQIGLIILDECHNCQKNTPYNKIMAMHRDMKLASVEPRPQILGMTASLDIGQAISGPQAEEKILLLCANLDAEVISTIHSKECLQELAEYQHVPEEDIVDVPGRKKDPFSDEINAIMEKIENTMQETEGWDTLELANPRLKFPRPRGNQSYKQWVVQTQEGIAIILTDRAVQRKLMACTDYLEKYNESLDINRNIRIKDALAYLEKYRQHLTSKQDGFDDTDKFLVTLFDEKKSTLQKISDDPTNHNPVLTRLGRVLKDAFTLRAGVKEKRGILFAQTRAFTEALKTWIEETPELQFLKPGYLTGSGKSGGMTQNQQVDLLERFRKGNHKLIIATSVAQEGLDIAQCNVVIRYNHISSLVGRVQTRGRNRAKGGLFYLVVDEQLKLKDKNMMNRFTEKLMMSATKTVQQKLTEDKQQMLGKIKDLQEEDQLDRKIKIKNEAAKQRQKVKERVKVNCRKCGVLACYSDDIRCIKNAHHVVVADGFTEKFATKENQKRYPVIVDEFDMQKAIVCKKCQIDWGTLAIYKGMEIPLIMIAGFIVEYTNGRKQRVKKWKDVLFAVKEMSLEDLREFVNIGDASSVDDQ